MPTERLLAELREVLERRPRQAEAAGPPQSEVEDLRPRGEGTGAGVAQPGLREQRYRSIVEDQIELIARWLPNGTLTFVNASVCDLLGIASQDLVGRNGLDLMPSPEERRVLLERVSALRSDSPLTSTEFHIASADGDGLVLEARHLGLFDDAGELVELQSVCRDISEHKRTEAELRERLRFQSCVSELAVAISRADDGAFDDTRLAHALALIGSFFDADVVDLRARSGVGPDRSIRHSWSRNAFSLPENLTRDSTPWLTSQLMERGVVCIGSVHDFPPQADTEAELMRAAGVGAVACCMLFVGARHPAAIVIVSRTERDWTRLEAEQLRVLGQLAAGAARRDEAEQARRRSEDLYRSVVQDQSEPLLLWAPDGSVLLANDPACALLGLHSDSIARSGRFEMAPADVLEPLQRARAALSLERPSCVVEGELTSIAGDLRLLQWTNRGFFGQDGALVHIQSVGCDLTDRMRAERQIAHRLKFQTLYGAISASLVNAAPDEIEGQIAPWLLRITEDYDLARVILWWRDDGSGRMLRSFSSHPMALDAIPSGMHWIHERLVADEVTQIESVAALPSDAALERDLCERIGIASMLIIPLAVAGERVAGCVLSRTHAGKWDDEAIAEFSLLVRVLVQALLRARASLALAHRQAQLVRAEQVAGVGSWSVDLATKAVEVSDQLRVLSGLTDGAITFERVFTRVHAESRAAFAEWIERLRKGEPTAESPPIRLAAQDGEPCYVRCRMELELGPEGRPLRIFGTTLDISEAVRVQAELEQALAEVRSLKERIEQENLYLRAEVKEARGFDELVGVSDEFLDCLRLVERVAPTESTVLIRGETGTGKQLIARAIHERSQRRDSPMVSVNCAALPETLIESELFGHEKGAFTGALVRRIGRFELADGGTLFLDEIGDLTPPLQTKLLRVLQEGEFERVGSSKSIHVDVRLITATHRDLEKGVTNGEFRADLYYRINSFPIHIPPLRERVGDIPQLVQHFVRKHAARLGRRPIPISAAALSRLCAYAWPGNIRELESVIQRALIISTGAELDLGDMRFDRPTGSESEARDAREAQGGRSLRDAERRHVLAVLEETNWVIEGRRGAAVVLGMKPSTLRSRMESLEIERPR